MNALQRSAPIGTERFDRLKAWKRAAVEDANSLREFEEDLCLLSLESRRSIRTLAFVPHVGGQGDIMTGGKGDRGGRVTGCQK